jgi:hypothetical protein
VDATGANPDWLDRFGDDEVEREAALLKEMEAADAPEERFDLYRAFQEYLREQEAEAGLRFEDLSVALAGGLEPPELLVPDLVVKKRVTWLAGHPGQGKSTVAMWIAVQHIQAGGHVIWLDWEGGVRETLLRLVAIGGLENEQIVGHFHYANSPYMTAEDGLDKLLPALRQMPGALVVFDSASKALSVAGLDENSPPDATRWTTHVVMPLRDHGATPLVIDHVAKTATRTTPYARGAGSKLADTDVSWFVEATEQFNQAQPGEVLLTRLKDRTGTLPLDIRLKVGDGQGGLPIERIQGRLGTSDAFRVVKNRVKTALREHESANASQLSGLVRGKKATVLEAAKALATDDTEPVWSRPGKRVNEVIYYYDEERLPPLLRNIARGDS